MLSIKIIQLEHAQELPLPAYGTSGSAGLDLSAAIDGQVILHPGQRHLVPTGLSIAIPSGFEGQIRPRSGLALKYGLTVLNTPATIDSDYRGELKVILINLGDVPFVIERGMRIAQLIIAKYETVLWDTVTSFGDEEAHRGEGFGSTGLYATP